MQKLLLFRVREQVPCQELLPRKQRNMPWGPDDLQPDGLLGAFENAESTTHAILAYNLGFENL